MTVALLNVVEDAAVGDSDFFRGGAGFRSERFDALHDVPRSVLVIGDAPENDVLAVEPFGRDGGDEELASVRVGSGVGHREHAGGTVLQAEVLVGEQAGGALVVDGVTAGTVLILEVSALEHETGNDAVEFGSFETVGFSVAVNLTDGESLKVLDGSRGDLIEELHDNSARRDIVNCDVEENFRYVVRVFVGEIAIDFFGTLSPITLFGTRFEQPVVDGFDSVRKRAPEGCQRIRRFRGGGL